MRKLLKVAKKFEDALEKLAQEADLSVLLADLRAASHIHQTHHWQTRGDEYYADHLLFERLYNESQEFIDAVAERAVGTISEDQVDAVRQIEAMAGFVKEAYANTGNSPADMVSRSLAVEEKVLERIKDTMDSLESAGKLSHGTSNMLEGVADKHETFVYLLGRRKNESNE